MSVDPAALFREWAPFVEELSARLGSGAVARAFFAHGLYDNASTTLTANYVAIALEAP